MRSGRQGCQRPQAAQTHHIKTVASSHRSIGLSSRHTPSPGSCCSPQLPSVGGPPWQPGLAKQVHRTRSRHTFANCTCSASMNASAEDASRAQFTLHSRTGLTSKQQQAFLTDGRDWQAIERFWQEVVAGRLSLSDLSPSVAPAEHYMPDLQLLPPPDFSSASTHTPHTDTHPQLNNSHGNGLPDASTAPADAAASGQAAAVSGQTAAVSGQTQETGQQDVASPGQDIELSRPKKKSKQDRCTYKVAVAYYGPAFEGWARQVGLPTITVEGALCEALQPLVGAKTKASASGAGRTDKGVSAVGQVFSFYSWIPLTQSQIANVIHAIPDIPPGSLRLIGSTQVPRSFHANFAATWRRYIYLFPLRSHSSHTTALEPPHRHQHHQHHPQQQDHSSSQQDPSPQQQELLQRTQEADGLDVPEILQSVTDIDPAYVHQLLQPLIGKELDYYALARDTPKGKDTLCNLQIARASVVTLPASCSSLPPGADASDSLGQDGETPAVRAMCVELVANRFLRKMVRVLVSTAIFEAVAVQHKHSTDSQQAAGSQPAQAAPHASEAGVEWGGLLSHTGSDVLRTSTCIPAPPQGLCFAGVGYDHYEAV